MDNNAQIIINIQIKITFHGHELLNIVGHANNHKVDYVSTIIMIIHSFHFIHTNDNKNNNEL